MEVLGHGVNATVYADSKKPGSVFRVFRVLYKDIHSPNSRINRELAFAEYMNEKGAEYCRGTSKIVGLTMLLSAAIYKEPITNAPKPISTVLHNFKQPVPKWIDDNVNPARAKDWRKTDASPYIAVFEYERCDHTFHHAMHTAPDQFKGNKLMLLYHALMVRWNGLIKDGWYLNDFHHDNMMNRGAHWYLIDYGDVIKVKPRGDKPDKIYMQMTVIELFSPAMTVSDLVSQPSKIHFTRPFDKFIEQVTTWPSYATEIEPTVKRFTAQLKAARIPKYQEAVRSCIESLCWAIDPNTAAKQALIAYRGKSIDLGDLRYAKHGFKMPTADQLKHAFTLIDLSANPTLDKLIAYHETLCC